jgi:hypothetical protein
MRSGYHAGRSFAATFSAWSTMIISVSCICASSLRPSRQMAAVSPRIVGHVGNRLATCGRLSIGLLAARGQGNNGERTVDVIGATMVLAP